MPTSGIERPSVGIGSARWSKSSLPRSPLRQAHEAPQSARVWPLVGFRAYSASEQALGLRQGDSDRPLVHRALALGPGARHPRFGARGHGLALYHPLRHGGDDFPGSRRRPFESRSHSEARFWSEISSSVTLRSAGRAFSRAGDSTLPFHTGPTGTSGAGCCSTALASASSTNPSPVTGSDGAASQRTRAALLDGRCQVLERAASREPHR